MSSTEEHLAELRASRGWGPTSFEQEAKWNAEERDLLAELLVKAEARAEGLQEEVASLERGASEARDLESQLREALAESQGRHRSTSVAELDLASLLGNDEKFLKRARECVWVQQVASLVRGGMSLRGALAAIVVGLSEAREALQRDMVTIARSRPMGPVFVESSKPKPKREELKAEHEDLSGFSIAARNLMAAKLARIDEAWATAEELRSTKGVANGGPGGDVQRYAVARTAWDELRRAIAS